MIKKSLLYHEFEVCRVPSTNDVFKFTCILACADYTAWYTFFLISASLILMT